MTSSVRLAVVGPGAIGSTFASVAQRAGVTGVALCGRTPLARITVAPDDGEPIVLSGEVQTDPAQLAAPVDWLLLAVKTHQTAGSAAWLTSLCGPDTVVVALQNGVEHRERVTPYAGAATVLPAIVWCPAEAQPRNGDEQTIRLRATPELTVPDEPAGHRLSELLEPGGARIHPSHDFQTELWRKLTMNAVAGLMVLTGRRCGMFGRTGIRELAVRLGEECIAVAVAEGARLDASVATEVADHFAGRPADLGTSILFDRVANRPLEWDARNGVVRRLAARHNIATPVSDVIAPLLAAASDDPN